MNGFYNGLASVCAPMTAFGAQVTFYAAAKRCLLSGASHDGLCDRHEGALPTGRSRPHYRRSLCGLTSRKQSSRGGALAVKVTTHAIEQRCHFRVLAQVDRAPEEEPMGRLVDAIG